MSSLVKKLTWSPNFLREFGFIHGTRLLLQNVKNWPHETTEVKGYSVPGYSQHIFMRSNIADHATFRQCMVMKQYDFRSFPQTERLMEKYRAMLEANKTPLIIDCGANIGLASLWFAKLLPEAKIIAIEPDNENYELLKRNTEHLGERHLSIKGGIWNKQEALSIANPQNGAASFQLKASQTKDDQGIASYTMDQLCSMGGSDEPLIIKLDIEGSQAALFESNTDWVARAHLITLELDDWLLPWIGTSRAFFKCLSALPFDYLIYKESIFCFRDFAPRQANKLT